MVRRAELDVLITGDDKELQAATSRARKSIAQVGSQVDAMGARTVRTMGRGSGANRAIQNMAFQFGDFATQVGAGTNASIALGQQLPQLLGGFGVLGAVLGAVVAIGVPLTRVMKGLSDQGKDMTSIFGQLRPAAEAVAQGFTYIREIAETAFVGLINNIDRLLVTLGTVAAFMAGKWVIAWGAATAATVTLNGALRVFRALLIKTGIGALIVGAGELVFQFIRLANAAGGFGEAFVLVRDLLFEVVERMMAILGTLYDYIIGFKDVIVGTFKQGLGMALEEIGKFVKSAAGQFNLLDPLGLIFKPPGEGISEEGRAIAKSGETQTTRGNKKQTDAMAALFGEGGQFTAPLEALDVIREKIASMKEDGLTLPDIFGANTEGDAEGEGKKKGKDSGDAFGGALGEGLVNAFNAQLDAIERTESAYDRLKKAGQNTFKALGNFIQQFAGKSKAAAIAAIAIQKALSIAQIIANTAAAQMRALAELGPIAGPPVAAAIGVYGAIQAALVAATGIAQAAATSGGGGGGGGLSGIQSKAESAQNAGSVGEGDNVRSGASINVSLVGDRFSRREVISLIEGINEAVGDGATLRTS